MDDRDLCGNRKARQRMDHHAVVARMIVIQIVVRQFELLDLRIAKICDFLLLILINAVNDPCAVIDAE